MAIAVVVVILSGVFGAVALWWSHAPMQALAVTAGAVLLLALAALVCELWWLDKELSVLQDRVRRLAELRAKSEAADSTWSV